MNVQNKSWYIAGAINDYDCLNSGVVTVEMQRGGWVNALGGNLQGLVMDGLREREEYRLIHKFLA